MHDLDLDDNELDAILRAADPAPAGSLATAASSPAAVALRDDITGRAARTTSGRHGTQSLVFRPRVLRPRVLLAAAVIGIATAAAVGAVNVSHPSTSGHAWAAEMVAVAEKAPRLLVGAQGWTVQRADEFSATQGEMTFGHDGATLDVQWVQGDTIAEKLTDPSVAQDGHLNIAGHDALVVHYKDSSPADYLAVWQQDGHGMRARGVFGSRADFVAVAGSLHRVDVDTWLSAMPATVIQPQVRAGAVQAMLADIPVPVGFDSAALEQRTIVSDRYQLGAQVSGAVACAWILQWSDAGRSGNAAARQQAVDAMNTSRRWAVLNEMNAAGDYPEVVWEYADAMASGGIAPNKHLGPDLAQSARSALGCD